MTNEEQAINLSNELLEYISKEFNIKILNESADDVCYTEQGQKIFNNIYSIVNRYKTTIKITTGR